MLFKDELVDKIKESVRLKYKNPYAGLELRDMSIKDLYKALLLGEKVTSFKSCEIINELELWRASHG